MVVTRHPLGSAAGLQMLAASRNTVDPAVAAMFTLSVVGPMMVGPWAMGALTCGGPTASTCR
jgi:gamma-glutamyltranspeptidase/glutathione hydrolase